MANSKNGDTSAYPHIKCKDGVYNVRWGKAGWLFILATLGLIGTSGTYAYKVHAGEEQAERTKQNIQVMHRNIGTLDEQARISAAGDKLVAAQMRALLKANGVTERIEPPAVEPSTLEALKE
jgi:hypothetical protein